MTFDQIVERVRQLRLERDQADAAMLLFMVQVELEQLDTVLDSGCDSFAQFVQEFVKPARYEAFKAGLAKLDAPAVALDIGSEATIAAGKLTDGSGAFVGAISAWRDQHAGTFPSRETSEHLLRQVDPRPEVPQAVRRQDRIALLMAENRELRAENAKLRRETKRLEAALAKKGRVQPAA